MGWSADETLSFAKLYLNHKCLWNTEDEDYKLRHKRSEAYRDISKKFHALFSVKLSEIGVKTKIKNLRSTYVQYVQKAKREQRSIDSVSENLKWIKLFYECFSRINIPRNLYLDIGYDQTETEAESSSSKIWVSDIVEESDDHDQKNPIISNTDDDYLILLKNEPEDTEEPRIPYKRKRKSNCWTKRKSLGDSSTDQSRDTVVKKTNSVEDEFDIYGKYIASQLREMGIQNALKVQLEIQNIVSTARLNTLSGNSN